MKKRTLLFLLGLLPNLWMISQTRVDIDAWSLSSPERPYDLTSLLVNASCTEHNGWERHHADASAGYNKHNTEFASVTYDGIGIESWYWNPEKSADLIWQNLTGLFPGTYRIHAYAVAQIYNDASRKGRCGAGTYLFAGEEKVAITSNKWQELSLTAEVTANQTLRIGICGDEKNENDWVSIAGVLIECIGITGYGNIPHLYLDERYDISVARQVSIANATLCCTLSSEHLTPLCLPFDMKEEDVRRYFNEVFQVTGANPAEEGYVLQTETSATLKAATPYMVRGVKDGRQKIELSNVFITPLNEMRPILLESNGVKVIGTYRLNEYVSDAYTIDNEKTVFVKRTAPQKIKGYSFYLSNN